MANSMMGLLGTKVGMTQLFAEGGKVIPCTVLHVGPNKVLQVKTDETRDGYNALQLGFGSQKAHRYSKPELAHFAKSGAGEAPPRYVSEIRVTKEQASAYEAGAELGAADVFSVDDVVDVIGTSKGKGFAGVMKRHNFAGFIRSHGTHEFFRHGGSIGTRLTPGFVMKGKKMPGRMGGRQVTMQNLTVVKVDADRHLVYVRGGVPGVKGSFIKLRKAVKRLNAK